MHVPNCEFYPYKFVPFPGVDSFSEYREFAPQMLEYQHGAHADDLNEAALQQCVYSCPLMPVQQAQPSFYADECYFPACAQCDPAQPAVPLGLISHTVRPADEEPFVCEHALLLHAHQESGGGIRITHGHHARTKRAPSPVKRLAEEIAAECEHFLQPDDCLQCNKAWQQTSLPSSPDIGESTDEKRLKNKEAARKYRHKLKSRYHTLKTEEQQLQARNAQLRKNVAKLEADVKYYQGALRENAAYWRKMVRID